MRAKARLRELDVPGARRRDSRNSVLAFYLMAARSCHQKFGTWINPIQKQSCSVTMAIRASGEARRWYQLGIFCFFRWEQTVQDELMAWDMTAFIIFWLTDPFCLSNIADSEHSIYLRHLEIETRDLQESPEKWFSKYLDCFWLSPITEKHWIYSTDFPAYSDTG